jgi:type I restriction enzyme M protein
MLQTNPILKSLINSLWSTFWSGGIANPITAIEQITYLLFIKRLDDLEIKLENEAHLSKKKYESKRFGGTYLPYQNDNGLFDEFASPASKKGVLQKSKILRKSIKKPKSNQELRWNKFKEITSADKLLEHVRYNVFPFIKTLNGETSTFKKYMENASFEIQKPNLLLEAINKIEEIYVEIEKDARLRGHSLQDIQGDVYEMLLSEIAQAGKNGQFRTPRHIIKLIVEILNPQLNNRIADPACGTSGFLLGAFQHIIKNKAKELKKYKIELDEDGFEIGNYLNSLTSGEKNTLNKNLHGFDSDISMVRLGLMNLVMHGMDNPTINYFDTLGSSFNKKNYYDIILANPPFTGKIDSGDKDKTLRIESNSTELLFLDRISSMLKKDGKAAVIIPEGVLFGGNKNQRQTREILLKDNKLEAVISLPSGAFKPYTGVKTSILVFTKVKENNPSWQTEKVWFYELKNDGYGLDDNRRKLAENPLPITVEAYKNRAKKTPKERTSHFYVPIAEIRENGIDLSYNRYKKFEYQEQTYEPPQKILEALFVLEDEIQKDMQELKNLIG